LCNTFLWNKGIPLCSLGLVQSESIHPILYGSHHCHKQSIFHEEEHLQENFLEIEEIDLGMNWAMEI
jgi:hypothetical protein